MDKCWVAFGTFIVGFILTVFGIAFFYIGIAGIVVLVIGTILTTKYCFSDPLLEKIDELNIYVKSEEVK